MHISRFYYFVNQFKQVDLPGVEPRLTGLLCFADCSTFELEIQNQWSPRRDSNSHVSISFLLVRSQAAYGGVCVGIRPWSNSLHGLRRHLSGFPAAFWSSPRAVTRKCSRVLLYDTVILSRSLAVFCKGLNFWSIEWESNPHPLGGNQE